MHARNPLVDCWRFRRLFYQFVGRDLGLRYRGSALGLAWAFASPLAQLAAYTIMVSMVLKADIQNYPAFAMAGFLPWVWFSTAVQMASRAVITNGALIKKIYFPTELLPVVSVTSNLVNFLAALPLLALILWAAGAPASPALLAFPGLLAVQFVFTTAVALLAAALNTFYRDTEHALGLALPIWLYLTPVLYPASFVPASIAPFLAANPMWHLVEGYRAVFLEGRWPDPVGIAYAAAASAGLLALAGTYFARRKPVFAEVL